MALKEELEQFSENAKKELRQLYEKVKQRPLTCITCIFVIVTAAILLIALPYWRVTQFGIADPKDLAEMENSYRATLAQILGGAAVGIGIYFAWVNLTNAREGQITDRFTRAIEQLGSKELEIRLGGIYALERIASESEKDYWPIMEILTAYIRKNSPVEIEDNEDQNDISMDIQAIIDIIGRCKYSSNKGKSNYLDLQRTYLSGAKFSNGNFSFINFTESTIDFALFDNANLHGSYLVGANLTGSCFDYANLKEVGFFGAYLGHADFAESNLEGVFFIETHLLGARFLTIDQLSKVKTLYKARLDPELEKPLREKYPALFDLT